MSEPRSMGVEEEMFLVDPRTGRVSPASTRALRADAAEDEDEHAAEAAEDVEKELFLAQIETATEPATDAGSLREHVVAARRRAARAAHAAGASLMATGTVVLPQEPLDPTPDERYARMLEVFGAVGRRATVCGMHVHVDVEDDDDRVRVVDRLRPWLPLLMAVSANSPFDHGEDTGYASWRGHVWDRWPSAGPVERFGSPAGYRAALDALVASGAALDEGMVYFDARPARDLPTVEVRVADVCTDVDDVVLVAALARALVDTAVHDSSDVDWRLELLRAARWRARREGVTGRLLHPVRAVPVPAADAFDALVEHVGPALARVGDEDLVRSGLDRLLRTGGGAARQREVAEREGLEAVVRDLVDRTEPADA